MSRTSLILVILQFSALGYFVLSGNLFADKILPVFVQLAGAGIAIWAIIVMRIGNFNIQPEVKPRAVFIRKGPYKWIRNPMYLGIILFFGMRILTKFNYTNLVIYLILCVVLLFKIRLEERFLSIKFGKDYLRYKAKTYRLLPFVY